MYDFTDLVSNAVMYYRWCPVVGRIANVAMRIVLRDDSML